uniref:Uncharacterized protein n=1 Tax=Anguilla anguilla TaxID=7936 RepID=A0A0E9SVJ8_ANGAN
MMFLSSVNCHCNLGRGSVLCKQVKTKRVKLTFSWKYKHSTTDDDLNYM